MIKIDNIKNIKNNAGYQHIIIVRSLQNPIYGTKHVPVLSPSKDLFYKYLDLKRKGQWNNNTFMNMYVPQFLSEMKTKEACDALNDLWCRSKTEDIALYCFCPNEMTCHRSIIAGLLLGAGAKIECNPEYIKYWEMYKSKR